MLLGLRVRAVLPGLPLGDSASSLGCVYRCQAQRTASSVCCAPPCELPSRPLTVALLTLERDGFQLGVRGPIV